MDVSTLLSSPTNGDGFDFGPTSATNNHFQPQAPASGGDQCMNTSIVLELSLPL
jgi:hypothetical protein